MLVLFIIAFVSIGFSFLCSVWEAVLLSVTPSYVQLKQQEGGQVGNLLKRFKDDVDQPLAAILTLNTIAHTVGAILVGATAQKLFGEEHLIWFGVEMPFGMEALIAGLMTLAILILSEIIPKTIGATYWQSLAPFTVKSLDWLIWLIWPLVWLSIRITRLFKGSHTHGSVFSRAEFTAMAQISEEEGVLHVNESRILRNLMNFEELTLHDIMTPRTVLVGTKGGRTIASFYEEFKDAPFSRYPVFKEFRDQITGFVMKEDVLRAIIDKKESESIASLQRDVLTLSENTSIHTLVDTLLERREHMAMVVDEFGGLEGVVTLEDAIETMLGLEIVDEKDSTEDMQRLARQRWERRAKAMGIDLEELEAKPGQLSDPEKEASAGEEK
ncbi:MAG: hemolysin family protein [Bacteroidota bacterium]